VLRQRVASALALGPLFLVAVVAGGHWLALVVLVVVTLGLREYARMARLACGEPAEPVLYPAAVLLVANAWLGFPPPELVFFLAVAGSFFYFRISGKSTLVTGACLTAFGLIYLPWFLGFLLRTRALPDGLVLALYTLIGTWSFDSVAYFAGLRWGRRRLCPAVSPAKSWEGALAGTAASLLAAGLFNRWLGWAPLAWVALGLLTAIAAQTGDLLESAFKRFAGLKDAGKLIPGHGGVLDRFDSMLLVAPAVYFLAVWLGS
jgi:phosphatidate cytidylyltransferase